MWMFSCLFEVDNGATHTLYNRVFISKDENLDKNILELLYEIENFGYNTTISICSLEKKNLDDALKRVEYIII